MGFGSFSSPSNSPIIKGKLFSRLTSNPPPSPGPASTNSSVASSPTSLSSPSCSLTSLTGTLGQAQQTAKGKAPTVLKLAAASQKLSLTKPAASEQQKESFSSTSRQHKVECDSVPQPNSSATSSVTRSSRSPTSLLPPSSSAMDTIFEEDGLHPGGLSRNSIVNHFGNSDMIHLPQRSSTFAPRSCVQSENGNNALTEDGDNGKRIVDNDTNFEESVTNFNQLHSSIEGEGARASPLRSPVRVSQRSRRRGATLSIDPQEQATEADKIQSTLSLQGDRNILRRQNSSDNCLSFRASSSPLSYSRSKTLPVSQSIHCLRSREAAGEMTRSAGNRPLCRTASVPDLDCVAEGEAKHEEVEWLHDTEPAATLRRSKESLSGAEEDKGTRSLSKRPKTRNKFPVHIQKMLTEHLQKKMATLRPQSPLVMHQMKSPHKSRSLRVSSSQSAPTDPLGDTKGDTPQRKLAYSRSISEPPSEDRQLRDNGDKSSISSRRTAVTPEGDYCRSVVAA